MTQSEKLVPFLFKGEMKMELLDAIKQRHSVRSYLDKSIDTDVRNELCKYIDECNQEGNLHIQLIENEPQAFAKRLYHYGLFSNVKNYIALVGKEDSTFNERCGYYGEKIVLKAQMLGLNTCWVGGTYKKIESVVDIKPGEKFLMIIAIGYGENQGREHKYKKVKDLSIGYPELPDWFIKGVEAVAMAPSALNQHSYHFGYRAGKVYVKKGLGFTLDTDIGIAKYHFEGASGKDSSIWE